MGGITAIYNSTPHSQSGYSPYLLMFSRDPRLPLDLWEEEYEKKGKSMEEDWLENCFKIQKNSWELARENLLNNWTKKNKSRLGKAKSTDLKEGQKVLIKENYIQGRSKLQNKFKNEEWVIEEVLDPEAGVFKIRPMGYEPKVLHRSNIRPIRERGVKRSYGA